MTVDECVTPVISSPDNHCWKTVTSVTSFPGNDCCRMCHTCISFTGNHCNKSCNTCNIISDDQYWWICNTSKLLSFFGKVVTYVAFFVFILIFTLTFTSEKVLDWFDLFAHELFKPHILTTTVGEYITSMTNEISVTSSFNKNWLCSHIHDTDKATVKQAIVKWWLNII